MPEIEEIYSEYIEPNHESTQSEIDAAINHAKSDLNDLKSEILGGDKKPDFRAPDCINNFYRLEGSKIIFQLDQVKKYLSEVHKRLQGMKNQKFGEISKEKNFTGTILAIQIALKAMETNPQNPKKYNIGKINGKYDDTTKNAIIQFQSDYKLQGIDGKPGKETIGKIINELDNIINNKKLERSEQEILQNDVTNIIEESIIHNRFSRIYTEEDKNNIINYIINGDINSDKNEIIELQIQNLANHISNYKLKYLIEHSNEPLHTNIQKIKEMENKNEISTPRSFDRYTSGANLTEGQKNTIQNILSQRKSPVTVEMVTDSCKTANIPVEYLLGFMQNDSRIGTMGRGARTHNPGNVGNTERSSKDRGTREKGVAACADNLKQRIDKYFEEKNKQNGKGFNDFPTPEELATGKTKGGFKFFGIYMTAPDGPKKVAGMVKNRANRLKGE